ncbi:hypothetical protein BBP40_004592 [Aspergillus hancockii]|nr:hypothetical protein BBP40_004592 [Aspergillus hancockii]
MQARSMMMMHSNTGSAPDLLPQQQQQQQNHQQSEQSYARSNMLPFTCGSFSAAPLCSMVDVPVSLPMVSPLDTDPAGRLLFGDGTFVDGGFVLDDIDVGALEREVLQEDWSWLSEEAL